MNMNIQEFLERFESDRDGEKLQHVLIGSAQGIHDAGRAVDLWLVLIETGQQ